MLNRPSRSVPYAFVPSELPGGHAAYQSFHEEVNAGWMPAQQLICIERDADRRLGLKKTPIAASACNQVHCFKPNLCTLMAPLSCASSEEVSCDAEDTWTNQEHTMQQVERSRPDPLPSVGQSRLRKPRLRRPTPLPRVIATRAIDRYINRLLWLFGGV